MELRSERLKALLDAADREQLVLPNFQRDFVWSLDAQTSLATSLLLGLPVGGLLFVSGEPDAFSARKIGHRERLETPANPTEYLLDGQQRLSTFNSIIGDPFKGSSWEEAIRRSYWNLRYRWCLRVIPDGENDPFGLRNLRLGPLPMDPEQFKDRFVPMRVRLAAPSEDKDWHHPAWNPKDEKSGAYLATAASLAGDAGLVPLWEVAFRETSAASLHVRSLQRIAQSRRDVLEQKIRSDGVAEDLREALAGVRPDVDLDDKDAALDALSDLRASWIQDMSKLLVGMASAEIPVTDLPVEQLDRAILTFEAMNRGGTPLSTFDLLTARLALAEPEGNLGELLYKRISDAELTVTPELWGTHPGPRPRTWKAVPDQVGITRDGASAAFKAAFLNALPLLTRLAEPESIRKEHMTQKAILELKPELVSQYWASATDAVLRAWAFLQIRCGVRSETDLRNMLLVLPISLVLRGEEALRNRALLDRLEYWYWTSVLTSTYTERQNDNALEDSRLLLTWAGTGSLGENPFAVRRGRVLKDLGYSDKETLTRTTEDAGVATDVGKYLLQYELSRLPYDIIPNEAGELQRLNAWDSSTQDHHLVPLGSATKVGESSHQIRAGDKKKEPVGRLLNSPLNRSFISDGANSAIRSMPISQYISSVPDEARVSRGLPLLDNLFNGDAESNARVVVAGRYDKLLEWTTEELDSLLHGT